MVHENYIGVEGISGTSFEELNRGLSIEKVGDYIANTNWKPWIAGATAAVVLGLSVFGANQYFSNKAEIREKEKQAAIVQRDQNSAGIKKINGELGRLEEMIVDGQKRTEVVDNLATGAYFIADDNAARLDEIDGSNAVFEPLPILPEGVDEEGTAIPYSVPVEGSDSIDAIFDSAPVPIPAKKTGALGLENGLADSKPFKPYSVKVGNDTVEFLDDGEIRIGSYNADIGQFLTNFAGKYHDVEQCRQYAPVLRDYLSRNPLSEDDLAVIRAKVDNYSLKCGK